MDASDVTRHVNDLTRRWVGALDLGRNQVVSGAGAWVVLAAALSGADGSAREELEQALGVSREQAAAGSVALTRALAEIDGVAAALGLWSKPEFSFRPGFVGDLQPVHVGPIEGREALDAWVRRQTAGQLTEMPIDLTDPNLVFVLAGALAADTLWAHPFECPGPRSWPGLPWTVAELSRTESSPKSLTLLGEDLDSSVSRVIVEGARGFDVHLLGGDKETSPVAVLEAGLGALTGSVRVRPPEQLAADGAAGMATCQLVQTAEPEKRDLLYVSLPAFEVRSEHNLIEQAEIFGLASATDFTRHSFPGMADAAPLYVSQAAQAAVATFTAEGFRAAAVTVLGVACGSALPEALHEIRWYEVTHDRPFGFLVVDRATDLVLFAGWVQEPTPLPEDSSLWW